MTASPGASVDAVEQTAESSPDARQQTPGRMLQQAREQRGLNVQQIADELHLDVRLVLAIEADNFLTLGAPVYAKGHLRKYSLLLGISPEAVLASYETLSDVPVTPSVIPVSTIQAPPVRMSLRVPALIVGGIVLAGVLVWIGLWLLDQFSSRTPAMAATPSQVHVPIATPVQTTPEATTPEPAPSLEGAPQATPEPAAEAPAVEEEAPIAPAGPGVSLRLSFTEASWVEIYDATDRRLAFGVGEPGQVRTVTGQAPLRVTLGLASAVSLEVNERSLPVPRQAGRDASRFTVLADGSVR